MIILLSVIILFSFCTLYLHKGKIVLVSERTEDTEVEKRKKFCIFSSLVWIIISGFRHVTTGADTFEYFLSYENTKSQTWISLAQRFYNTYAGIEFQKDPGYRLFVKFVQIFIPEYQEFLVLIAIIFFVPMGIWIYRNSRVPYISFVLFTCLFYAFYAITGHRQTIATALVVFVGEKFIRERKLWLFLGITLVAATIHKSCFCYVPAYFLYPIKGYNQRTYLIAMVIGLVLTLLTAALWRKLVVWLRFESFLTNDIGGTGTYVLIYLLVMSIVIVQFSSIVGGNSEIYGVLNMMLCGTILVILSYFNQSFMRVQQYYTLYLMILLPEIVLSFKGKESYVVAVVGCLLLIGLMIKNNPYYLMCWQNAF